MPSVRCWTAVSVPRLSPHPPPDLRYSRAIRMPLIRPLWLLWRQSASGSLRLWRRWRQRRLRLLALLRLVLVLLLVLLWRWTAMHKVLLLLLIVYCCCLFALSDIGDRDRHSDSSAA